MRRVSDSQCLLYCQKLRKKCISHIYAANTRISFRNFTGNAYFGRCLTSVAQAHAAPIFSESSVFRSFAHIRIAHRTSYTDTHASSFQWFHFFFSCVNSCIILQHSQSLIRRSWINIISIFGEFFPFRLLRRWPICNSSERKDLYSILSFSFNRFDESWWATTADRNIYWNLMNWMDSEIRIVSRIVGHYCGLNATNDKGDDKKRVAWDYAKCDLISFVDWIESLVSTKSFCWMKQIEW